MSIYSIILITINFIGLCLIATQQLNHSESIKSTKYQQKVAATSQRFKARFQPLIRSPTVKERIHQHLQVIKQSRLQEK